MRGMAVNGNHDRWTATVIVYFRKDVRHKLCGQSYLDTCVLSQGYILETLMNSNLLSRIQSITNKTQQIVWVFKTIT